jgi:hypothetical protein
VPERRDEVGQPALLAAAEWPLDARFCDFPCHNWPFGGRYPQRASRPAMGFGAA